MIDKCIGIGECFVAEIARVARLLIMAHEMPSQIASMRKCFRTLRTLRLLLIVQWQVAFQGTGSGEGAFAFDAYELGPFLWQTLVDVVQFMRGR